MQTFTRSVEVQAPPSKVFGLLTDLEKAPVFMPDIVDCQVLTDGSFGVGTRWKETRRFKILGVIPFKATADIEVTEFVKNKTYTTVSADDCNWASYRFNVKKNGKGSLVELVGEFKCIGKHEGNDKKAAQLAKWCEKADGDLLDRVKAAIEA